MGQLINRFMRFAKSMTVSDSDGRDPLKQEDDELRRIIDELNRDYKESKDRQQQRRQESDGSQRRRPDEQSAPFGQEKMDLDFACKTLKITKDASNDEIKAAYKQRMKEYHPDRVASLGDELQDLARKKSQQINNAYAYMRKIRNF